MTSKPTPPKVFIIGGTGAQGIPVIRGLVEDGAYHVRVLTRDPSSPRARHLLTLGGPGTVELVTGTFASTQDLREGFRGCTYAFVNIDGFNAGEKGEMFWAMRAYELARENGGVKFFVYGNLDYGLEKGDWKDMFRCGHYDGKGRVGEWILQRNEKGRGKEGVMGAALFTTGPYIEMVLGRNTVSSPKIEDGTVVWKVPLGQGAVPHVALDDCAFYVRWLFDHQDEANGMDLEVAIEHVDYHEMAKAFTRVTGKPARYEDIDLDTYFETEGLSQSASKPAGYNADPSDAATMTIKENFTGFWNLWKHSGGNRGVIQRDYALLDRIHPGRIRSAEEWFRKEDEKGRKAGLGGLFEMAADLKFVLKLVEDRRQGKI